MKTCYYPEIPHIIWREKHFVIGVTGCIAAGKSFVSHVFAQCGALVIDADAIAKEVLQTNVELRAKILDHLALPSRTKTEAEASLRPSSLASIIFSNKEKRLKLNQLMHPLVHEAFVFSLSQCKIGGIVVYDIPLLFESMAEQYTYPIDLSICIDAPLEMRYQRAYKRNLWTKEEFLNRDKTHFSMLKKQELADLVIRNTESLAATTRAVQRIHSAILAASRIKP